jgi:hypothetical protein
MSLKKEPPFPSALGPTSDVADTDYFVSLRVID